MSVVCTISWFNRWNWTKLAQIYHWDWRKKWLDFGDLYLVFKVTLALWNWNFDRKKACVHTIFWTNGWNFKKLVLLEFGDLDFTFKFMPALRNLNFDRKEACVHTVSWTNGWNFNKLVLLEFGWPWLYFQVHASTLKLKFWWKKVLCFMRGRWGGGGGGGGGYWISAAYWQFSFCLISWERLLVAHRGWVSCSVCNAFIFIDVIKMTHKKIDALKTFILFQRVTALMILL